MFLLDNFTASYRWLVREGRLWTAMTYSFSHAEIPHLLFNMVNIYSILHYYRFISSMISCNIAAVEPFYASSAYLGFVNQYGIYEL
jgi:membrane associated rhomboid family serine protease